MTEHDEQVQLIRWAGLARGAYPALRWLHAVPNGGARNIVVARKLKAEGVQRGVPDLCLPVPRGPYHGLYIELKRAGGGYPTPEQREWLAHLDDAGYRATWCRGWEQARNVIVDYLEAGKCTSEN